MSVKIVSCVYIIFLLKIIYGNKILSNAIDLNLCNDWDSYKDQKCYKILNKESTEPEAIQTCRQLDSTSTLITIHSEEEQDFLNNLFPKYTNTSTKAWIGLQYRNRDYEWIDETHTDYTNWAKDAVKNGTNPCVLMSLNRDSLGKWSDELCLKFGLIVCQKRQEITVNLFQNAFENLTKLLTEQQNILNEQIKVITRLEEQTIPIGFLYTQLPNQSEPSILWPKTEWSEVTKQYSGLFFRAEGLLSAPFGQIQQQNYSHISDIVTQRLEKVAYQSTTFPLNTSITEGQWSDDLVHDNQDCALNKMFVYTTTSENRPVNTAVKIWKRIQ